MKRFFCRKDNVWSFAAGIVATIAGIRIAKSPKTREVLVSGLAKGMKLQHDAQEMIQNMREEAEDLVVEATREAEAE
ncbi:MAG: DUF1490 domain-containing protein [Peptostreptococcaceae bacterium]|nr:DUF1490 domain-containing protein [Peptostreptococcaceae bacterium]